MLCPSCNQAESDNPAGAWLRDPERNVLVIENLIAYAEYLDPGVDLEAEMMEWVQEKIAELERG